MAGSLAAVKKELRNRIRDILKDLPEAAAASQSMHAIIISFAEAHI